MRRGDARVAAADGPAVGGARSEPAASLAAMTPAADRMHDRDETWQAFLSVYGALPRQGPGDPAMTRTVLDLVPGLPAVPRVVDAGCGSGASTLVLAESLPTARILAVDVVDELLGRLRASLAARGIDSRVRVENRSMDALTERGVDLVWSEGAAYSVGVPAALRHWADVVRPGGSVVFSEACWFAAPEDRPAELVEFWAEEYPALRDEAGVRAWIEASGAYDVVATERLERAAWVEHYYGPLGRRCRLLRPGAAPALAGVLDAAEREIAMFERFGDRYGYTFFVLRRR